MANDLETMRRRLSDQLSDTDHTVWNVGEKDDLLSFAVRKLNSSGILRPLDPDVAAQKITLVSETYFYSIDAGITHISRIDFLDTDGDEAGPISGGAWEVTGDLIAGTAKLHVAPRVVEQGGTLRILGYGRYTLPAAGASAATAIPDDYVTLVLALARAEAYRRVAADRMKFKQWRVTNQVQNVSVNELVQMINEADATAERELVMMKRWRKPVPGRV